ncbi:MAG: tRNA 2-thiouridine(34) synthase MnmA [bacterium]
MKTVGVAMSGGVDSSAAALILKQQGYKVFGVSMSLFEPSPHRTSTFGSCCSLEDIYMAKKAARILGIPHYTLNLKEEFKQTVIQDFIDNYVSGKTPNPCITCNRVIKFDVLLNKIKALGADFLATGHYIQCKKVGENYVLSRGRDTGKDQSYFLYNLTQKELKHLLFPVGKYTKQEVRALAKKHKLPNADKEESQEICFVEDGTYPEFIKKNSSRVFKPGIIYDKEGKKIGTHKGFIYYTIGQRKGLELSVPGPKYVLWIDPDKNVIIAGDREETHSKNLIAADICWVSGRLPKKTANIKAQIRYRHQPVKAKIKQFQGGALQVRLTTAQHAVTPGQAIVFYAGKTLLGGGTIEAIKN